MCKVHLVIQSHLSPGDVGGQFTPPSPSCPRDPFTFRCTVTGDSNGVTIWRVGGSSDCVLIHTNPNDTDACGPGGVFEARFSTTTATSFTSTLSCGMTPIELDGMLVECFGPTLSRDVGNMVGSSTLQIVGQYYPHSHALRKMGEECLVSTVHACASSCIIHNTKKDLIAMDLYLSPW